jgi:hypothetical protein
MATGMYYGRPTNSYPRRQPYRSNVQVTGDIDLGNYGWTLDNLVGVTDLTMEVCIIQAEPIILRNCPELINYNTGRIQQSSSWNINNNPVLTTIQFASLFRFVTLDCSDNVSLSTLTWYPNFTPPIVGNFSSFGNLDFSGCALSVTSVNALLALLIIINIQTFGDTVGNWAGTVDLSGGTNAAPTGQGITDKAALILRGATVTTN